MQVLSKARLNDNEKVLLLLAKRSGWEHQCIDACCQDSENGGRTDYAKSCIQFFLHLNESWTLVPVLIT